MEKSIESKARELGKFFDDAIRIMNIVQTGYRKRRFTLREIIDAYPRGKSKGLIRVDFKSDGSGMVTMTFRNRKRGVIESINFPEDLFENITTDREALKKDDVVALYFGDNRNQVFRVNVHGEVSGISVYNIQSPVSNWLIVDHAYSTSHVETYSFRV